jgi:hypothetical protein
MITMNAPSLPPATLTDDALKLAAALLQIAADRKGTKSRLAELNETTAAVRAAIAEHDAAKKQAEDATAALTNAEQLARDLAVKEDALVSEQTRLNVASSALAERERKLGEAEKALAQREQEHQVRVKANEARIAAVKSALA